MFIFIKPEVKEEEIYSAFPSSGSEYIKFIEGYSRTKPLRLVRDSLYRLDRDRNKYKIPATLKGGDSLEPVAKFHSALTKIKLKEKNISFDAFRVDQVMVDGGGPKVFESGSQMQENSLTKVKDKYDTDLGTNREGLTTYTEKYIFNQYIEPESKFYAWVPKSDPYTNPFYWLHADGT
jgi:hypothetical protein